MYEFDPDFLVHVFAHCIAAAKHIVKSQIFFFFFPFSLSLSHQEKEPKQGGVMQGLFSYLIPPLTLYCMFKLVPEGPGLV